MGSGIAGRVITSASLARSVGSATATATPAGRSRRGSLCASAVLAASSSTASAVAASMGRPRQSRAAGAHPLHGRLDQPGMVDLLRRDQAIALRREALAGVLLRLLPDLGGQRRERAGAQAEHHAAGEERDQREHRQAREQRRLAQQGQQIDAILAHPQQLQPDHQQADQQRPMLMKRTPF